MRTILVWLLKAYRLVISPLYGQVCCYHPSCSAYALEAVQVHGAARGSWLAVRRLARCHPWTPGGYDPVPARDGRSAETADAAVREDAEEAPDPLAGDADGCGVTGTGQVQEAAPAYEPASPAPASAATAARSTPDRTPLTRDAGEATAPGFPSSSFPATSRGARA